MTVSKAPQWEGKARVRNLTISKESKPIRGGIDQVRSGFPGIWELEELHGRRWSVMEKV